MNLLLELQCLPRYSSTDGCRRKFVSKHVPREGSRLDLERSFGIAAERPLSLPSASDRLRASSRYRSARFSRVRPIHLVLSVPARVLESFEGQRRKGKRPVGG